MGSSQIVSHYSNCPQIRPSKESTSRRRIMLIIVFTQHRQTCHSASEVGSDRVQGPFGLSRQLHEHTTIKHGRILGRQEFRHTRHGVDKVRPPESSRFKSLEKSRRYLFDRCLSQSELVRARYVKESVWSSRHSGGEKHY